MPSLSPPNPGLRTLRPAVLPVVVILALPVVLPWGCAGSSGQASLEPLGDAAGLTLADNVDQLILVDCLLPGQIRKLGRTHTFMAPRRAVKATRRDCEIRGGEYVLFDRSDYGAALATLKPKAQGGDPVAQTYVGEIYEKGLGLASPDYAAAAGWYERAAAQGHAPAQTSLGALYERGLGVPKDELKALDLYRRAAGVTEDRLIFESQLEAERAAFRKELALRNQVAASLQQQLRSTRAQLSSASAASRAALERQAAAQQRSLASLKADTTARARQLQREEAAAQRVAAAEQSAGNSARTAQAGKLALVRGEQSRQAQQAANRIASATP
jgi:hypothetical protein